MSNESIRMVKSKGLPVEIQAASALILIQIAHKFVAEIQGAIKMEKTILVIGILVLAAAYVLALVLGIARVRWGFIIGIVLGAEIVLQPIIFHVIRPVPADPPYYILFPILQGILVIYFCWQAYRTLGREKRGS
ncbi:MAG: hypothetical protein U9Q76_05900, partial [candidate division WOR-3 bacterium]|nr:hypothetical protein [candidate division WOR-3 bacterium]